MKLLYKQIYKSILKNRGVLTALFLFITLVSFMYYFVHFSVDFNVEYLINKVDLLPNEEKYYIALQNNLILIRNFSMCIIGVLVLIVVMFIKNFIKKNQVDIANMMAIGFIDKHIKLAIMSFMGIFTFLGLWVGIPLGYIGSDILLNSNMITYQLASVQKGIWISTVLIGVIVVTGIISITTYLACIEVDQNEIGLKLKKQTMNSGNRVMDMGIDRVIKFLPRHIQFKARITLKSINSIMLLFTAILAFNILFILSISLYQSSIKVYNSQVLNHNYKYNITYDEYKRLDAQSSLNGVTYLKCEGDILLGEQRLPYKFISLDKKSELFYLINDLYEPIEIKPQHIILNPEIRENYGINIGDKVILKIKNQDIEVEVQDIGINAELKCNYLPKDILSQVLKVEINSYNGMFSNECDNKESMITQEEKLLLLERDATSNKTSAVINQVTGGIIACLLIYLAILIVFTNNTKNILIFDLIGYTMKEINNIILKPLWVVVNVIFIAMLFPAICIARKIQIITSIQTKDYMPFQIHIWTVIYMIIILNVIVYMIIVFFNRKIVSIIDGENQSKIFIE